MRSSDKPKFEFTESTHLRGMPPAAGRERGVVKMIKYETTRTGLIVNYSYAFISPDSGPESPDVFLHPSDVDGLGIHIREGDTVEYSTVDFKGRPKAVNVVKVLTSVPVLRRIGSIDARILALEPPHVAKDGRRAPVDDPHRQPRGQATHCGLPQRDEAPAGRDRRLRRGRDEGPVVRVTITTSKSRKRRALVAKTKDVVYSSPYPQLVVVTPRRPKDPRRPLVDGLPGVAIKAAGAAQVAVQ